MVVYDDAFSISKMLLFNLLLLLLTLILEAERGGGGDDVCIKKLRANVSAIDGLKRRNYTG